MCSLGCDYCWLCFGSWPESFSLAENFLTALDKPTKPCRWATLTAWGVWAPPCFPALDGSLLSISAAHFPPGAHLSECRGLGACLQPHSTAPCRAKLPLPRPRGQASAWERPSHRCQTLQPLVTSCLAEAGGIHGHFPGLQNLAVMFFTLREHKHVQRVQWCSTV